ncbi:MAG: type VI secretion system accessory protein TagJ [Gammaproteobacteria bacterium]
MSPEQLLRDGDLDGCLDALQSQIRSDPGNLKYRIFLFQLLAVMGYWKRALTQLDVIKGMDTATWPLVQTYREALHCEVLRSEIFAGKHTPLVFGDPQQWVALLIEALRLYAQGAYSQCLDLREKAFALAPASTGKINEQEFLWIADADPRLGPVLEAIVNGNYYWVPIHQIREIRIEAPEDLRDFVWAPAHFEWSNGGEAVGLIPTRYPGSEGSADPKVRLARKTDWIERQSEIYEGLGQRLFATDVDEFALLDSRVIQINPPASA